MKARFLMDDLKYRGYTIVERLSGGYSVLNSELQYEVTDEGKGKEHTAVAWDSVQSAKRDIDATFEIPASKD